MMKDMIGFCGDACNYCPRYIATFSGSEEELKKVAVLWKELGFRKEVVAPEEIACVGCTAKTACSNDVARCAGEKLVRNCGQCTLYPCDMLTGVFEKTGEFARRLKESCPPELYAQLEKAFFRKRQNLDNERKG